MDPEDRVSSVEAHLVLNSFINKCTLLWHTNVKLQIYCNTESANACSNSRE